MWRTLFTMVNYKFNLRKFWKNLEKQTISLNGIVLTRRE
jgi:hypothetical protein